MVARLRSIGTMIFRRSRWEAELKEELQFHLEARADALVRAGLSRDEAMRRARVEFGRLDRSKEGCRDARGGRWIDELSRNLMVAMRSIRKYPGFSAVAVLSLALGIGANLAVFAVLQRLVLTSLPVRAPGQLFEVSLVSASGTAFGIPFPRYELIRDNFDIFKPLFGWGHVNNPYLLGVSGQRRQGGVAAVTGNYFEALGLRPAMGRLFTAADDSSARAVVISYELWQSMFLADAAVVGRSLTIGDAAFDVVGVAPRGFTGMAPAEPASAFVSLAGIEVLHNGLRQRPGRYWFHVVGRLPPEVSFDLARARLRERWPQLDEPFRQRSKRNTAETLDLVEAGHGYSAVGLEFSTALVVLMGLVGAVFLIACANLMTLLFVRGANRLREMSIRAALGASRPQLVRQWLTECLVLALVGGGLALIAARWITMLLLLFVAEGDRPWLQFEVGPGILALSAALTLGAGLLCGWLPALRATGAKPETVLRSAAGAAEPGHGLARDAVLAAQVAASLVLIVGAALFARTLWNLNSRSSGFDRQSVVYAVPEFVATQMPQARRVEVTEQVLERVRRSPLVETATLGGPPMVWGDAGWGYVSDVSGYTMGENESNIAWANSILPGYFDVLQIPLLAGRDFEDRDRPPVGTRATTIIINESMARHYFGGRNPIGQHFVYSTPFEVIGVVQDTKNRSLRDHPRDVTYMPLTRDSWSVLIARAKPGVGLLDLEAEIRRAFESMSREITVEAGPIEDAVQRSLGRDRLVARLSAVFGVLGIVLASMGLYAAIGHSVSSRTREIGIRIAIGATARRVSWMILRQSLAVTVMGLLIGLPLVMVGSRYLSSLLFEVSPSDPATLIICAAVLTLTGLLAGWWPARRAARLDPSTTLRFE